MKALRLFCVAMMACLAVVACSDDDDEKSPEVVNPDNPDPDDDGTDEPTYVGDATLSTDSQYYEKISDLEGVLIFPEDGGSVTFTVTGDEDWTATCISDSESDFGINVDESGFTVSADGNSNSYCLSGEVTLTITDLEEDDDGVMHEVEVVLASVHLVVTGTDGGPLILAHTIEKAKTRMQLPIADFAAVIDWGDGTVEYFDDEEDYPLHTFANTGDYDVCIYGNVETFNSLEINGVIGHGEASYDYDYDALYPNTTLTAVKSWGGIRVRSARYGFVQCTSLKSLPEVTGNTFWYNSMFEACFSHTALEVIPSDLFAQSYFPTTYREMGARNAFSSTNITEIPEGLLDVVTCGDIECMFANCTKLASIPGSLFDKVGTTIDNFHRCFYNCTSLTSIPTELWAENTNVANLIQTFAGCTNLTGETPYSTVGGVKYHLYERTGDILNTTTHVPPVGDECFKGCTGLTDYGFIPTDWK